MPKNLDPFKLSSTARPLYWARRQRVASRKLLVSTICTMTSSGQARAQYQSDVNHPLTFDSSCSFRFPQCGLLRFGPSSSSRICSRWFGRSLREQSPPSSSVVHSMRRGRFLFLLILSNNKAHPYSQAVNPDEFAAAKCGPDRRKDQEKFLRLKDVRRALNFQLGSRGGNVPQQTLSSPCPIDGHYVHRAAEMFKSNTIRFSTFPCHRHSSAAVGSELDASRKVANQENVSRALRRVTASFGIGGPDE